MRNQTPTMTCNVVAWELLCCCTELLFKGRQSVYVGATDIERSEAYYRRGVQCLRTRVAHVVNALHAGRCVAPSTCTCCSMETPTLLHGVVI